METTVNMLRVGRYSSALNRSSGVRERVKATGVLIKG